MLARRLWQADVLQSVSAPSVPSGEPVAELGPPVPATQAVKAVEMNGAQVVIGIGNPGARYADTPHNIGHDVLDRVAVSLDAKWVEQEQAVVARQTREGRELCLIKLQIGVNASGAAVRSLSECLGFGAADCILVHDDLDLPLGTVRSRMRGSAGGHRGVASVLDAFQSDAVRRVKVGIGRPGGVGNAADYVLRPFEEADRALVEQACKTAVERILHLATAQEGQKPEPKRKFAHEVQDGASRA